LRAGPRDAPPPATASTADSRKDRGSTASVSRSIATYGEILKKLDPERVYAELVARVAPEEPVLLCWEVPPFTAPQPIPQAGLTMIGRSNWWHRRIVAAWFKQTLGIDVSELDLPGGQPVLQLLAPAPKGPTSHVVPRPGIDVPILP
jgi:hypothetical protein